MGQPSPGKVYHPDALQFEKRQFPGFRLRPLAPDAPQQFAFVRQAAVMCHTAEFHAVTCQQAADTRRLGAFAFPVGRGFDQPLAELVDHWIGGQQAQRPARRGGAIGFAQDGGQVLNGLAHQARAVGGLRQVGLHGADVRRADARLEPRLDRFVVFGRHSETFRAQDQGILCALGKQAVGDNH